jgi:chromosome partitioning protein
MLRVMATVISFINYKGGVGKTTTTYHIGCVLAYLHKKRVLLVDIDPQCNLTFLCAIYDRWNRYIASGGETVVSLFEKYLKGKGVRAASAIWKSPIEDSIGKPLINGLDLIPSNVTLLVDPDVRYSGTRQSKASPLSAGISAIKVQAETYVRPRIFLRNLIDQVKDQYDYVLIDCPPNLYLLTQNALLASDFFVVTTLPDHLSTIGIELLMGGTEEISKNVHDYGALVDVSVSAPEPGGIIFVKVLRQQLTRMHADTIDRVTKRYPNLVFSSYTTDLTGYQEASARAVPVFLETTENAKRAADQYIAITNEFLKRFP